MEPFHALVSHVSWDGLQHPRGPNVRKAVKTIKAWIGFRFVIDDFNTSELLLHTCAQILGGGHVMLCVCVWRAKGCMTTPEVRLLSKLPRVYSPQDHKRCQYSEVSVNRN